MDAAVTSHRSSRRQTLTRQTVAAAAVDGAPIDRWYLPCPMRKAVQGLDEPFSTTMGELAADGKRQLLALTALESEIEYKNVERGKSCLCRIKSVEYFF